MDDKLRIMPIKTEQTYRPQWPEMTYYPYHEEAGEFVEAIVGKIIVRPLVSITKYYPVTSEIYNKSCVRSWDLKLSNLFDHIYSTNPPL